MSLSALLGAWLEARDTFDTHFAQCRYAEGCDTCVRLAVKEVEAQAAYREGKVS